MNELLVSILVVAIIFGLWKLSTRKSKGSSRPWTPPVETPEETND